MPSCMWPALFTPQRPETSHAVASTTTTTSSSMWAVWEDVQLAGQSSETPTTLYWSQTTTSSSSTTTTTYNYTTTKVHHQPSIHVNGRCCGTLQHQYAGYTAPRPPVNRPPPTIDEDLPHQTPRVLVPGYHHECVPRGGGSERCYTSTSYPNLGNDCSRRR